MEFHEQQKEVVDGIPLQYLCHFQETDTSGMVYPAHYHSYIEILYCLRGEFNLFLNGKENIFKKNDFVLINSKEVHLINSILEDGGKYIVLRFEPEVIFSGMTQNYYGFSYGVPYLSVSSPAERVVLNEKVSTKKICDMLHEIINELENKSYGYELAVKNLIGDIFLWITRYWYDEGIEIISTPMTDIDGLNLFEPALKYVRDHFSEDISAVQMAKLCGISKSYFSRRFNKFMKTSFSEYVNYIRMSEAERLLAATDLNITEVGDAVGICTTSYFIKLFKKYRGISPKNFKSILIKKEAKQ